MDGRIRLRSCCRRDWALLAQVPGNRARLLLGSLWSLLAVARVPLVVQLLRFRLGDQQLLRRLHDAVGLLANAELHLVVP